MKYVLIDDERMAIEHLKMLLLRTGRIKEEQMVTYTNPMEAMRYIEKNKPEVMFVDIEMPMVSGITLVSRIRKSNPDIFVVFVTAHKQYAVEAFEQYALDYLLKPLSLDRVKLTVDRIEERHSEKAVASPFENTQILFKVMGDLSTMKDGIPVDYKWRSGKIRELFAFFLHNRKRYVSKYEIFETILPEEDSDKSTATLNMILYRLRNKLQQLEIPVVIKFQDDAYKMVYGEEVQVDMDLWEHHLKTVPMVNEKNLRLCLKYLALVEGPYMSNLDYPWLVDQHEVLQEKYLERMKKIEDFYFNNDHYEEALDLCRKIYEMEPLNEALNIRILDLLHILNHEQARMKFYEDLRKKYSEFDAPFPVAVINAFKKVSET